MKLTFYKTLFGQWRWRLKSSNGKVVSASSESFKNRIDCIANAKLTGAGILNQLKQVDHAD